MTRFDENPKIRNAARLLVRWFLKTLLFVIFTVIVLNPDVPRAISQVYHTFSPERLIQPGLKGMAQINGEIDALRDARSAPLSEVRTVELFIRKRIRYASDYSTWWNVEYWPTASEVWKRKQEDCDGRAILAVSILRSRGYHSARLAVGLQHMWVQVDENEKETGKSPHIIGLLSPERRVSLPIDGNPNAAHYFSLAKALFQPAALRDTGIGWMTDVPGVRKVILMLALLLFCFHPCRHRKALTLVMLGGSVAAVQVVYGSSAALPGLVMFLLTITLAVLLSYRLSPCSVR